MEIIILPGEQLAAELAADEHRCAAVGNRVISIPTSAMIMWAAVIPTPGISSRRDTVSAKGAISASIRSSPSMRSSIWLSENAWWSSK